MSIQTFVDTYTRFKLHTKHTVNTPIYIFNIYRVENIRKVLEIDNNSSWLRMYIIIIYDIHHDLQETDFYGGVCSFYRDK